jgi:hypothetical protein
MTNKQKEAMMEHRELMFPAWRITKRRTTEKTGIKKYPYRAMIGGYWVLLDKDKNEKIHEHRYNFIRHYRIFPSSGEVIHHIDGIKTNNEPSNLRLMKAYDHLRLHEKIWRQVAYLRRRRKHGIRSNKPRVQENHGK